MSLRDAQFKIKDLESSLKNEITLHQSIARRYEFHDSAVIKSYLNSLEKLMNYLFSTGVKEPLATGKL